MLEKNRQRDGRTNSYSYIKKLSRFEDASKKAEMYESGRPTDRILPIHQIGKGPKCVEIDGVSYQREKKVPMRRPLHPGRVSDGSAAAAPE